MWGLPCQLWRPRVGEEKFGSQRVAVARRVRDGGPTVVASCGGSVLSPKPVALTGAYYMRIAPVCL